MDTVYVNCFYSKRLCEEIGIRWFNKRKEDEPRNRGCRILKCDENKFWFYYYMTNRYATVWAIKRFVKEKMRFDHE